jgi:predicted DNA-binding mobile mystery protein A
MMRTEFQNLRLKQLDRSLKPYRLALAVSRPSGGWIRAVRQALGISASEVARRLGKSRQLPLQLEKAEAADAITLKSLRSVADALGCDLVYALVPKSGLLQDLPRKQVTARASEHVLRVEHSMALEDQAAGGLDAAIAAEVLRRSRSKGRDAG